MKKIIVGLFLVFQVFLYAQEQETNTFQQSENAATGNNGGAIGGVGGEQIEADGNPPNDGDPLPVPIDNYIPFLAISGGLIIFYLKKNSKYTRKI